MNIGFDENYEISLGSIKMSTSSFRVTLANRPLPTAVVEVWFHLMDTAKSLHMHDILMIQGRQ